MLPINEKNKQNRLFLITSEGNKYGTVIFVIKINSYGLGILELSFKKYLIELVVIKNKQQITRQYQCHEC